MNNHGDWFKNGHDYYEHRNLHTHTHHAYRDNIHWEKRLFAVRSKPVAKHDVYVTQFLIA